MIPKKMGDFIEPGTISKLELKKNKKWILVIALNLKNSYMRFLSDQLNRTLIKKNIDMKDT